MNEDVLNVSVRKFLKKVGITSQREIEQAVRAEPPWRGAPMTISVGISVLGEDGRESATLMDVADEARFAATAEGVGLRESAPAGWEPAPPGGPHEVD